MRCLLPCGIAFCLLAACSSDDADRDNDGVVDAAERAAELAKAKQPPLTPGLWEKRYVFDEIDVPSLSDVQKQRVMTELGARTSGRSCLSAIEAVNPGAQFFGGRGIDKCSYEKFDISGSRVKMEVNCAMEGAGAASVELKGRMGGKAFNFDSKAKVRLPVLGAITLKGKATGRYVGSCTPATATP